MSATATFTSQALAEWVRLFPQQALETNTSSNTFMKQLTVVVISTITYLKNAFPEENYTVENFGDIKLRILKKNCTHDLAQFIGTALTHAFEALDKKYLDQLVICFYDGENKVENLVEYHIFNYLYNPDGVAMNMHSETQDSGKSSTRYTFDNVRQETLQLIRVFCVVMQACQNDMPESYDVTFRLSYNKDAPNGYQAPGFLGTTEEHLESTLPETVKLGCVKTPYHSMTARTYIRESQTAPQMTKTDLDDLNINTRSAPDASEMEIQCPCINFDADDISHALEIITHRRYCSTQRHAACLGLSRDNAARVQRHCSTECSDMEPSREPTDQQLASLSEQRASLSILRRTIEWCSRVPAIGVQDLVAKYAVSPADASKVLKLMYGIIDQGPNSEPVSPCEIIKNQLISMKNTYFLHEEPDLADRCITQSLPQSSQPDPAEEVHPKENVILQNATLGKIIDPEPEKIVEVVSLKGHEDAIMCDVKKEQGLPLSGSPDNVEDLGEMSGKRISTTGKVTIVQTKRARSSCD